MVESLNLYSAIYHFVKPNSSLKSELEVKEDNRRWLQETPMMAAGITDHIWTEEELLTFRVFDPTFRTKASNGKYIFLLSILKCEYIKY